MVIRRQGITVAVALGLLAGCGIGDKAGSHTVRSVPESVQISAPKLVYTVGGASIRSGPSATSEIVRRAPPNQALKYLRLEDGWYELAVADGQPAQWVHSRDVITAIENQANQSVQLELSDIRLRRERKYVLLSGVVTNVSGSAINDVVVDVIFINGAGGSVTSASAMVASNPVGPGQSTTFSAMDEFDPEIVSATVSLRTQGGKLIRARYVQ
jgi:hypothetical protein